MNRHETRLCDWTDRIVQVCEERDGKVITSTIGRLISEDDGYSVDNLRFVADDCHTSAYGSFNPTRYVILSI